jgi:hypothetical protein
MKTISLQGHEIIGCHVFTKVIDGNHVPFSTKKVYTLVTTNGDLLEASPTMFKDVVVGTGIRQYSGTLETGGGRHNFYGTDLADALDYLDTEYKEYLGVI